MSTVLSDERLWHMVPDALLTVDGAGVIASANAVALELFEFDELVGVSIDELVPPEYRSNHPQIRASYAAAPVPMEMGSRVRLEACRSDGTVFPALISLSPVDTDGDLHVLVAVRDLSLRTRTERQLDAVRHRYSIVAEQERIARQLHDTVIQELFAASLSLSVVAGRSSDRELRNRALTTTRQIDSIVQKIRETIFGFTEPVGAESGLGNAVYGIVDSLRSALGFAPAVVMDGQLTPNVVSVALEHVEPVVRELLTNVAKHAEATSATLRIEVTDELTIEVEDDGVRVDGTRLVQESGGGLHNMASRAQLLGGSFELVANELVGMTARWSIPLG